MTDELLMTRKEILKQIAMCDINSEDKNEEELLRKKNKSKKKKKKSSRSNRSASIETHSDSSRERKKKERSPELFPSIRDVRESLPQSIDRSQIFPSTSTSYDVQDGPASPPNPQLYQDLRIKLGRRRSERLPSRSKSRSRFDVSRHEKPSFYQEDNLPRHDRSLSPKRHHLSPNQPGYDLSLSPQRMPPSPYERPPRPSRREQLLSSSRHSRPPSPPPHKRRLSPSRHSRSPSPPTHRRTLSSSRYSRSPSAYRHSGFPTRHGRPSTPPRHTRPLSPPSRGGPRTPSPHSRLHSPPRRRARTPPIIAPRGKDWYRHRDQSRDERYQDSSPISRSNTHRFRGSEMHEKYSKTVYRPKRRSPEPNYPRARPFYSEHRAVKQQRYQKGLTVHSGIKQEKNLGTAVENLNKIIEKAAKEILHGLKVPKTPKSSEVKGKSLRKIFSTIVRRLKEFLITPDTTNEDMIQQYHDKYSKAEDELLLEEYFEKYDISPHPAVIPKTEISSPQTDDILSISPDEQLFIIDNSGYYVHITVNKNERQKYYIAKKKLIHNAKSLMKKVECYANLKLMMYVMKLRIEERIDELLKDEKNKLRTKLILEMYRNKYPITGDEEFVTETLHAIWLGKYNDGVRPKKPIKIKNAVTVKQETPDASVKQERPDNGDENDVPQTSASVKQEPTEEPSTSGTAVKTEKTDAEISEATQSVTIKAEPVEALLPTVTPKTEKPDSNDGGATVVRPLTDAEPAPSNIKEERHEESVSAIAVKTEQAESVDDITSVYKRLKVEPLLSTNTAIKEEPNETQRVAEPRPTIMKTEHSDKNNDTSVSNNAGRAALTAATMTSQIKDTVEMPQPIQDTKINSSSNDDGRLTNDDEEVAVIEPETVTVDLCAIEEFKENNMEEIIDKLEIQKKIKKEKIDSDNQIKIKKEANNSIMPRNIKMETPDTQMEAPKEQSTSKVKKEIKCEINTSVIPQDTRKRRNESTGQNKEVKKEVNTDEVAKKMKKEAKSSEENKKRKHRVNASEAQTDIDNKTPGAQTEIKKRKNITEEKTDTVEGRKIIKKEMDSEIQKKEVNKIDISEAHKEEEKCINIREDQKEKEKTNNKSEAPKVITKSTKRSDLPQELKIKINKSDVRKAMEKIKPTSESQKKSQSEKNTPKMPRTTKNKIISTEGQNESEKTMKKTEVSTKMNDKTDTLEEQKELINRMSTSDDEPKKTEQLKHSFEKQNLIQDSTDTSKIKRETKNNTEMSKEHKKTEKSVNTSDLPKEMNIKKDASDTCKETDKTKNTSEKLKETDQTINTLEVPKEIDNKIDFSEVQNQVKNNMKISEAHNDDEKMIDNKIQISADTSRTQLEIKKYTPETQKKTEVMQNTSETQNDVKNKEDTIAMEKKILKTNNASEAQKEINETAESASMQQKPVMTSNMHEKKIYTIDLIDDDSKSEATKPNKPTKDTEDSSEAQKIIEPPVIDVSDDEQEAGESEAHARRQAADTTEQQEPIVVDSDSDDEDCGKEPESYVEISDEESEDAIVRTGFNETPTTTKQLSDHHISYPTQESIVQLATTQASSHDITALTENNSTDAPTTQPGRHDTTNPTPKNSAELASTEASSHNITVHTNNVLRTTQPTDKINESIRPKIKDIEPNFINNEPTDVETTKNPTRMETDETTNLPQAGTADNATESVENIKQFLLNLPIE